MKSIAAISALVAVLLCSGADAHQTTPSRSRSHHAQLASSLAKKAPLARRATPSGWTSVGCVTEGTNGRALTGYGKQGIASLTVESCLATCASMAYQYGGLEYGNECYCSDALANGGGKTAADSECSSTCSGDSSSKCGGSNRLNLYKSSETSCSASAAAGGTSVGCFVDNGGILTSGMMTESQSNTPASCITTCKNAGYAFAGVEFGKQCFCGKTNTGALAAAGDCSTPCPGDSTLKCGNGYRMNVYSISASSSCPATGGSAPSGWTSLGCYTDSGSTRSLSGSSQNSNSNTAASCTATCASQGYKYAGTQYGNQCYCGNTLGGHSTASTECSSTCAGDSSTKCGGSYRLNIYQSNTAPTGPTGSGYSYLGCYADSGSARALNGPSIETDSMTNDICAKTCFDQGYPFAGTEYGKQCYCGSNAPTTSSTNCNVKCAGDQSQTCGGGYTLTVVKSTATAAMPLISGWSYSGCYTDSSSSRALMATFNSDISTNTLQSCTSFCGSKGYAYAGAEYGNQCMCGNSIASSAQLVDGSQCDSNCAGNSAQKCGGNNRITIYGTTGPKWNNVGCVTDSNNPRALTGAFTESKSSMTVEVCQQFCKDKGFTIAGLEYYSQCYCGNSLSNGIGAAATGCDAPCSGNSAQICGGSNRLNVYNFGMTPIQPNVIASTGPGGCPASGSFTPTLAAPASSSKKYVFSHHIVGNTFPFTQDSWLEDITLAYNSGVDAFALNLGTDSWQRTQVASAYAAAKQHGKGFKLFFSFDMSVWGCGTISNSMVDYIAQFAKDDSQMLYNNKVFVSSFAGEECGDAAWVNMRSLLSAKGVEIYFVPGFFGGVSTANWKSIDGNFNWNSAWSMDANMITTDSDAYYMNNFLPAGKSYMPGVSPLFYAHYGPNSYNKNWYYQSDAWVLAVRWQQVIAMRDKYDFVEEITWNDFGESHYMGPIKGAQPNSQSWVNGVDHQALLQVNAYYHTAFKTGSYPAITCDKIYLHARPHTNEAPASSDSAGGIRPTLGPNGAADSYKKAAESFFALVFATADGDVAMTSGSSTKTFAIKAGINILTAPLVGGSGMSAKLTRKGATYIDFTPSYTFKTSTDTYSWNHYYFASN